MSITNKQAEQGNQKHWDEIAPIHFKSYDIDKLKNGGIMLDNIQIQEMGDVKNKSLLHLQCHIGTDSLSWERLGAIVTGIDFSEQSIKCAEELKSELGMSCRFIHSNIYDLKEKLNGQFDIVYTSQGVLCWLKDTCEWAKIISHFLKPGGVFYLMETHPVLHIFDDIISGPLQIKHSYFHKSEPTIWDDEWGDYSNPDYILKNPTYEWTWNISDIINSLIKAGLNILFFNEYEATFYKALPNMVQNSDGWWYLPDYKGKIPLTFTLKAIKKK